MKSIATLLRIKQRELDVLKRQQALVEKQRDEIQGRIDKLANQLLEEIRAAEAMPEMSHFFGDFSISIKKRQLALAEHRARIDKELDKIAGQILDRFGEMKKYEISLANWKKRKTDAENHRNQQEMDEVALRGYIRRDVS